MIKFFLSIVLLFLVFSNAQAGFTLSPASFSSLPGWQEDDQGLALQTFKQSCQDILHRNEKDGIHPVFPQFSVKSWQTICFAAQKIHVSEKRKAREFFETWFVPYHVSDNNHHVGLFTGYYLPLLQVRKTPNKRFHVPIYALPGDLVKIDLGLFDRSFSGKFVTGQVIKNSLLPYPDRAAINEGKIKEKAKVLFWSDDSIDVYFAQIQGSALVELPNNQKFLIGYAGGNGRAYTSIGKILKEKKELDEENISMQSIREWLNTHPKQVHPLLNQNRSYVFFRLLKNKSPLGTEQVPLTPERSLAIDKRFIPLGAPMWLNTFVPGPSSRTSHFRHLMIAQDTGGAIKGIVRGDVYWGAGKKAEFMAGHMNSPGEYWLLLPVSSMRNQGRR